MTPGQEVKATRDAYPTESWTPRFVRFPTADRQKATVKVRMTFDKLEDFILPDMGVKVAFLEEEQQKAKGKDNGPPQRPTSEERGAKRFRFFRLCSGSRRQIERRAIRLGTDVGQTSQYWAACARRLAGGKRAREFARW